MSVCTNPASASVLEEGQQPAWKQSEVPVLERELQATKENDTMVWGNDITNEGLFITVLQTLQY